MKVPSYNTLRKIALLLGVTLFVSCADFIDVGPPKTQIVTQTVFQTEGSAISALSGVYSLMMTNTSFTRGGMEEYTGVASDELINYSTNVNRLQFSQNTLTSTNGDVLSVFWQEAYKYISNANVILEGLDQSPIPEQSKNKLIGEALFIRAFCHFYLAAVFGDIPYLKTADYKVTSTASRDSFQNVLNQIEIDLLKAQELMSADFTSNTRVRPNKGAATALLARLFLYKGQWANAEALSTSLITNSSYTLLTNLNEVFLPNSKETIWQLQPVITGTGAPQASQFIISTPPNGIAIRVSVTPQLFGAFETNDQRKANWMRTFSNTTGTWYYMYKYRGLTSPTEYSTVFRIAEQYLIRAEARTQLGNFEGARSDLNAIRSRASITTTAADGKENLLKVVLQERRVELFGEFGHRWLDLKRMGKIDETLAPIKSQWKTTAALFPIPEAERILNTNLSQNPGY